MGAIATSKFRIHNAEQFFEAFSETSNTMMYFFVGKPYAWPDEAVPPTPTNSTANIEFVPWRDMFAAKRIQTTDVSHAIERYDWSSGRVYDAYDDLDTNLLDDDFYVLTEDFNVYKCLFNNGGVASTVKPTGTSTSILTTADGYKWKYIYSISTGDVLKFLTSTYMPVKTNSTVSAAAVDGGIDIVKVSAGGTGYTSTPTVTILGDGVGATATATVTAGAVSAVTVANVGSGYTSANVSITGGGGANATGIVVIGPKGGHGSNAIEELGGKFIMVNARLDGTESSTFSTDAEIRQIGLIRDPTLFGTSNRAGDSVYRQTFKYNLTSVSGSGFTEDETVRVGGNTAIVVEYDSSNTTLFTTKPMIYNFANGATITGASSNTTATISVITNPGLEPYSGDILYVENRVAITRATDQIEDVKVVVEF